MIEAKDLASLPLFAGIPEERLAFIAERAADLSVLPGEYLMHEGEIPAFFVLLSGTLQVTKRVGVVESVLGVRESPGDCFGEVPLQLGSTAFANLRASSPARVVSLGPIEFQRLLEASPNFAREMKSRLAERVAGIRAFSHEMLAPAVTVIGRRWEESCHDVRDFLARNRIAYEWLAPEGQCVVARFPNVAEESQRHCPVLVLQDGRVLIEPTIRELACALGLRVDPEREVYDLVVVGGGPAGLAAAVYGASEGLATAMLEREAPGGQAGTSSRIENYLGFPTGISGDELGHLALEQAQRLGAEIVVTREVLALEPGAQYHTLLLDGDTQLRARAIVVATGVNWRRLDLPGADALTGRGIFYGAARTETMGMRGRDVVLIGGGNSAGQAAIYFSGYARSVTMLVRGNDLSASMSRYLIDHIATKRNIRVQTNASVVAVEGEDHLEAIVIASRDGERVRYETSALFVFIGADAQTNWLPPSMLRDGKGYVLTGLDIVHDDRCVWPLARDPFLLETSIPGIFAAGDVRHGSIKRVAASVGEGSMAIAFTHQALAPGADQPKALVPVA